MSARVAVLGGGIGGMTAAHELSRRGFHVEVFERLDTPGGKSRSIPVPGTGTGGRKDLPGEHGFRFFPGFYEHLPDTMARIPRRGGGSCLDNLVPTTQLRIAREGRASFDLPTRFPTTWEEVRRFFEETLGDRLGLERGEGEFFALRLWQVMTSCRERRLEELEKRSWWDFVEADRHSEAYRTHLAEGLSRSLVAARAREASARTIGQVQVHLFADTIVPWRATDRVLNAPTNEALIEPWLRDLDRRAVRYEKGWTVESLELRGGAVAAARLHRTADPAEKRTVEADWFVSGLPVEAMARLVTPELLAADPTLGVLPLLAEQVRWMNGVQFFLREDVPINEGHTLYVDSPWALTSISQGQFWRGVDLRDYGDGAVRGILSVDVSDWTEHARRLPHGARDCATRAQVMDEVWAQLQESLNVEGQILLRDEMVHSRVLDPAVRLASESPAGVPANDEPLFINMPDCWRLRPQASTGVRNLFLAADYVQTNADLACMESANEAARRAVNALLAASGSPARRCRLFEMDMPELLQPLREWDRLRWHLGRPWKFRKL